MSISEEVDFDKDGIVAKPPFWKTFFLSLVIILVATLSFGLGKLSITKEGQGIKIEYDPSLIAPASAIQAIKPSGPTAGKEVIGSKNGTKYHYPHCPGAKQIKEENKITFSSREAAEASGYTLASNCK